MRNVSATNPRFVSTASLKYAPPIRVAALIAVIGIAIAIACPDPQLDFFSTFHEPCATNADCRGGQQCVALPGNAAGTTCELPCKADNTCTAAGGPGSCLSCVTDGGPPPINGGTPGFFTNDLCG